MAELIKIHPDNPERNKINRVVEVLRKGGLVIYPTDTVYGIGCDLYNQRSIERICRIKEIKPNKMNLSFICYDLSDISTYARVSNEAFRVMKKALPGPFTFILESSSKVPKMFDIKKKQVGIRVPDNQIPRCIVQELGNPILNASVKDDDEILEYMTDPSLIYDKYHKLVDIVIDGGYGHNVPSTVIDCSDDNFEVIRQGLGEVEQYF